MNLGAPSQWVRALGIENSLGGPLRPREIQMPGGETGEKDMDREKRTNSSYYVWNCPCSDQKLHSGKTVFSKMDEFPENFRTAFDPAPFSEIYCNFFRKPVAPALNLQWNFSDRKWPPPFRSFFRKFMTKIAFSKAKKLQWNFFDRKWPPPPFGNFPEIHRFSYAQASLSHNITHNKRKIFWQVLSVVW